MLRGQPPFRLVYQLQLQLSKGVSPPVWSSTHGEAQVEFVCPRTASLAPGQVHRQHLHFQLRALQAPWNEEHWHHLLQEYWLFPDQCQEQHNYPHTPTAYSCKKEPRSCLVSMRKNLPPHHSQHVHVAFDTKTTHDSIPWATPSNADTTFCQGIHYTPQSQSLPLRQLANHAYQSKFSTLQVTENGKKHPLDQPWQCANMNQVEVLFEWGSPQCKALPFQAWQNDS